MIVDCESCHTRFRLEDEKIPATGARVRCSRCKTAFVVHRPGTTVQQVVEEVVAEATGPTLPRAPDAAEDLFESSGRVIGIGETQPPAPSSSSEPEEQWEFDESPPPPRAPEVAPPPARKAAARSTPELAIGGEPREEETLPSLGAPSDWDFLGASSERIAADASFRPASKPAAAHPAAESVAARFDAAEPIAFGSHDEEVEAGPVRPPAAPSPLRDVLASALDFAVVGSGWITASALCLIGFAFAVQPRPWATEPRGPQILTAAIGGAEQEASLVRIENAVAGSLIVVRGQLPAGAAPPATRLRATWLDASGAPLAAPSAIAGPPVAKRRLRELSLARLQEEHEARALELGGGGAYEAVFPALPDGAARISFTREPMPANTAEAVVPVPADGVTASSPRAALPSSE